MKPTNKRAVTVGLFIFIGIVVLILGILTVGNLHETFVKKIIITSVLDDANGLQAGNNVWFSGVKIGTVNKLSFYGKSQVKINMKIDEKSQQYIRKDAKVKISTDGLIGNKIIIIYGGTSKAGAVTDGDTLGIEKLYTSDDMIDTLQANNINLLSITTNLKTITHNLADGQGTLGKLLNDETIFNSMQSTILTLQKAAASADKLTASLADYSTGLNKKGTLANELVTDTVVFNSLKSSVMQLQKITVTADSLTANLKNASKNPNSPIGVLLHDEKSGALLKSTLQNLDSSSYKLNQDLEALQHNFLLRGYFKNK